jgi:thymidylate synthase
LPRLVLRENNIFEWTHKDFELIGYKHHPAIKGDVAV